MNNMEAFFVAISNFGFPIAVSAYLLFRFESKIDHLSERVDGLSELIRDRRKWKE